MIRPPLEACRERKWETIAVSFAVIVVLAIPLSIGLAAICARSAAADWLRAYTPIVYLQPDVTDQQTQALAREVTGWRFVDKAEVRTPQQAAADLEHRLGKGAVRELGITAPMLPTSIVVHPAVPIAGHIDIVSRVAGLQARQEVDSVEVPSSGAMRAIRYAAFGLGIGALLGLGGLVAALVLLLSFLTRLRETDDEVDRVLALFGARTGALRRPTIIRGLAVGGWCGLIVTFVGCGGLVAWRFWAPAVMGIHLSLPNVVWPVVASPLLIVPLVGFLSGVGASREPVQIWRRANG